MADEGRGGYPVGFIAKFCNLTERRVQQLVKEGVMQKPDARGQYDLIGCVPPYIKYLQEREETTNEPQRVRLDRLRGDREELELARLRRELVAVQELSPALEQFVTDVCATLDAIPEAWADPLHQAQSLDEKHQLLADMVVTLREALGGYRFAVKRINSGAVESDHHEVSAAA